jgi:hypothetical protein
VLEQLQRQSATLAGAAERIENASLVFREKNGEQVADILRDAAREISTVTTDTRRLTAELTPGELAGRGPAPGPTASGGRGASPAPAGDVPLDPRDPALFAPVAVPAAEPASQVERQALQQEIRDRLRLLQQPYLRLVETGAGVTQVEELVRACRDATNRGALRQAALSFNTAAQAIGNLLGVGGAGFPAAGRPDTRPSAAKPAG